MCAYMMRVLVGVTLGISRCNIDIDIESLLADTRPCVRLAYFCLSTSGAPHVGATRHVANTWKTNKVEVDRAHTLHAHKYRYD